MIGAVLVLLASGIACYRYTKGKFRLARKIELLPRKIVATVRMVRPLPKLKLLVAYLQIVVLVLLVEAHAYDATLLDARSTTKSCAYSDGLRLICLISTRPRASAM